MPTLGLLIDPDRAWIRNVVSAVVDEARQIGWQVELPGIDLGLEYESLIDHLPLDTGFDGFIASSAHSAKTTLAWKSPTVLLGFHLMDGPVHFVSSDYEAMGRMAADELLETGVRQLLAFTTLDEAFLPASERVRGFVEQGEARAATVHVFDSGPRTRQRGKWMLGDQLADLADEIHRLPKPLGVACINPDHTLRAAMVCRTHGLRVPDDVLIVCIGDDDTLFESLRPSISGITENQAAVGKLAVRTVQRLYEGERIPRRQLIAPLGVMSRGSTEFLAIDDPDVSRAIRFIWANVERAVQIGDVVDAVAVSRSTLQRRFEAVLGRSPGAEIRRSRLQTARRLLIGSNLPLSDIAMRSGFGLPSMLSREIKRATGFTPTELRRQHREALR